MILAQLDKVPADFWLLWCLAAFAAMGVAVMLVTLWSNLKQRPPHETPTRREFDSLAAKVEHIEASLPTMERRILEAVEGSSERTSAKMDAIATLDREGRVEIWERFHAETKRIGERVASLEAKGK